MEIDLTPKMSSMLQSGIASYPGSSPAEKHVFFFAGEEPGCKASLGSSRWCDPPPFAMVSSYTPCSVKDSSKFICNCHVCNYG